MLKKILPAVALTCLISTGAEAQYYNRPHEDRTYHNQYERYHYTPKYQEETNVEDNKFKPRFYIGGDFSYSEADYKSDYVYEDVPEKGHIAMSFNAGFKLHKNLGIEAFYERSSEEDASMDEYVGGSKYYEKMTTSYQAFGVDIIGYLPLNQDVELLAAVGLGEYKFKGDVEAQVDNLMYNDTEKDDKFVTRFGIGVMYNINQNIAFRTMFRYIPIKNDYLKNIKELSVGMRYSF